MKTIHKRVGAMVLAQILAISLLLVMVAGTLYADDEVIPRFTFGGGAESVASGNIVLRGGMGQPIASVSQSENGSQVCTGFECGVGAAPADTPTATATPDPSNPTTETPVSETPVSETPVSETPVSETPVSETPVSETPVSETPTSDPTGSSTPEPSTPGPSTPEPPQPGSSSDVVINEVYYQGDAESDWIELRNIGEGTVDISEWHFCALFSYKKLGDNMTVLKGDLLLGPGEIVVLRAWTDLDANGAGSDLAIYTNDQSKPDGRPDFSDPDFMVDFVQWGTGEDVGRPDVAVAKGIWAQTSTDPVLYDFVPFAASGEALALKSNNRGTASADFANQAQTQGTSNADVLDGTSSDKLYLPMVTN